MKIKRDDLVKVIAGKDKVKKAKLLLSIIKKALFL